MRRRRIDAVKNVAQRISNERTKKVAVVAMENHPESAYDFDKIIRTHSCKEEADLLERVVAIAASYLPGVDRKHLRDVAFSVVPIDQNLGKKRFECVVLNEVEVDEFGWSVYWEEENGICAGTLLPFSADGYEPQVGDEAFFYVVRCTELLGRVVNGHVFSYRTLWQDARR